MKQTHYSEVPRNDDPNSLTEIKEVHKTMVPLDLENMHNSANRLDYLTLRLKFFVPIIFILVTFPFAIILIFLSFARSTNYVLNTIGAVETISYISQSNPVVDIQPITGSQVCSDNVFQPSQLGTWGGTNFGCYCANTGIITEGECRIDQLSQCQNLAQRPSVEAFTWNGDRFCMRRLYNFIRTAGTCPTGYTKCGTLFCSPPGESCPISDVLVLSVSDPTPAGYTARPLTFDKKLVFISDATSDRQFAQFSYSMQTPCIDSYSFAPRTNANTFLLEKQKHIGCGKYESDIESVPLDTVNEQDFYIFNFVNRQTDSLPIFNTNITGSSVTLSARYRFLTRPNDMCAQFYISKIPLLIFDVEEFSAIYRGISITGMILSTITSIIAIVYIKVIKRDGLWMINREEPFGRRFIVQIVCFITLYAVTTAILGMVYQGRVSEQESYFKDISGADCFVTQPKLNEAMDDMTSYLKNKIDGLVPLNILLAVISAGVTVFVFLNLIFRRIRRYDKSD